MSEIKKDEIKKDSIVKIKKNAKSFTGKSISDLFFDINCYVMQLYGDATTVGVDGHEIATVKKSDLILVKS